MIHWWLRLVVQTPLKKDFATCAPWSWKKQRQPWKPKNTHKQHAKFSASVRFFAFSSTRVSRFFKRSEISKKTFARFYHWLPGVSNSAKGGNLGTNITEGSTRLVVSNMIFTFNLIPREMIQLDEHIFQMSWFNHQLWTSSLDRYAFQSSTNGTWKWNTVI